MLIATRSGKINISKEKDTKLVAERFSKLINLGDFILLTGSLGVGKTTFTKYIINSLQRINRQQIELWNNSKNYENKVYVLPKHLDEKVARLHLDKVGAKLTPLSKEQAYYISVTPEGPYKPHAYRY